MGESSWNGYEHNCLFANVGDGQFVDVARPTGGDGTRDGRAMVIADLDADGRLDVALNNNNARPTIYLNRLNATGNWVRLELVGGAGSNRDAVGARVRLTLAGDAGGPGKTMTRWVEAGSGYASQSAFPVHFGLGEATELAGLEITWPSGRVERLEGSELAARVALNHEVRIEEAASELAHRSPEASGSTEG